MVDFLARARARARIAPQVHVGDATLEIRATKSDGQWRSSCFRYGLLGTGRRPLVEEGITERRKWRKSGSRQSQSGCCSAALTCMTTGSPGLTAA